jgi:hypothetical protein
MRYEKVEGLMIRPMVGNVMDPRNSHCRERKSFLVVLKNVIGFQASLRPDMI